MTEPALPDVNHVLDVREIDGEPFDDIMDALDALPEGEQLVLVNSFEPVPLYGVMESRGFTYDAERVEDEVWHILVEHAE